MDTSLLALVGFAVATSITPGPNNIMIASSAANHGLRATIPHLAGIATGFVVMIALVGLGLAGALTAAPAVALWLRWIMVGWLLLLAWKIARAGAPGEGPARPPMGLLGGALFQWVNPKAWMIALSANSAYIGADRPMLPQLATILTVFAVIVVPCMLPWAALGSGAGRLLRSRNRLRAFNVAMAVLLVASVLPLAIER
jgi:threonine/homoserine/homoserine lactone efflux protein